MRLKYILVGDTGVGKSRLLCKILGTSYHDQLTIGVEHGHMIITINESTTADPMNNHSHDIDFWDTAGQEQFRSITRMYYRNADVIILVYDVTKMDTIHNIKSWFEEISSYATDTQIPKKIILLGNKTDLIDCRVVSQDMGEKIAADYGMDYHEVTAMNDSIIQVIHNSVRFIVTQMQKQCTQSTEMCQTIHLNHHFANKIYDNPQIHTNTQSTIVCKKSINNVAPIQWYTDTADLIDNSDENYQNNHSVYNMIYGRSKCCG